MLYHTFTGGRIEARGPCPEGVGWLWPTMYLESLWNNRANRSVRQELIALGRRLRRIRAFAQLSLGDPLACLMHLQWSARVWTTDRSDPPILGELGRRVRIPGEGLRLGGLRRLVSS